MGKKRKTSKKKQQKQEDFGTCEFFCTNCDHTFEVEWITIWEIQESTHGYVGFHTFDTYIACPICNEIVENDNTPYEKEAFPSNPF
ncbi:hypothetical protein [Pseudalkalibacillus caeni]|uniref:Uncharacterized protein n=1 Tax=Exobacillus caeni TaxID=2574798 RepID=A0A5R9FGE2_9BACL|nr:hypothetical protein [Pseudalkalibacillus caeni]TLS38605.1 hypothetical protein FCL54_03645 [Pseudalkalibacillus caeni]